MTFGLCSVSSVCKMGLSNWAMPLATPMAIALSQIILAKMNMKLGKKQDLPENYLFENFGDVSLQIGLSNLAVSLATTKIQPIPLQNEPQQQGNPLAASVEMIFSKITLLKINIILGKNSNLTENGVVTLVMSSYKMGHSN